MESKTCIFLGCRSNFHSQLMMWFVWVFFTVCNFFPLSMSVSFRKKMKIFSESHKTVFVVDHCPYMAESCRQHVEFDMLVKNRTQGIIPLAPISKSLWTCSVESSMEYCRIMYDIFPFKKLVGSASHAAYHAWYNRECFHLLFLLISLCCLE